MVFALVIMLAIINFEEENWRTKIILKYYTESEIRKIIQDPYIGMLNSWSSLCKEKLGGNVEVLLVDRHDDPQFSSFKGELNTAIPDVIEDKVKLIVYLDSLDPINEVIFTHEIGHWILKLKGFPAIVINCGRLNSFEQILINSLIQHPPLYSLQRSLGINPQAEIDLRAEHNINLFNSEDENNKEEDIIINALTVADDLISCSKNIHNILNGIMLKNHPKASKIIDTLIETKQFYDLDDPRNNLKFVRMLIKKIKIKDPWHHSNEINHLKSLVKNHN